MNEPDKFCFVHAKTMNPRRDFIYNSLCPRLNTSVSASTINLLPHMHSLAIFLELNVSIIPIANMEIAIIKQKPDRLVSIEQ